MKYLHKGISEAELKYILKELNVTNRDDIFVHGTDLNSTNCNEITESIFENGVSKNTRTVAPFMSMLATISLLSDDYDVGDQILNYHIGNTIFVLRIPEEYQGLYFGKVNQKYAGRVAGMQDSCVSILDVLELENIPNEFVVCSIKKSNEQYGKYDMVINPKYFEIDKNNNLKEKILTLVEKYYNSIKKDIVKDYMNIEPLNDKKFEANMDLAEHFLIDDKEFIKELYSHREKKNNIRK